MECLGDEEEMRHTAKDRLRDGGLWVLQCQLMMDLYTL